ncbi:hypothetical protein IJT93_05660 [bacterium]|nr:hypothetical protein [bacterium]
MSMQKTNEKPEKKAGRPLFDSIAAVLGAYALLAVLFAAPASLQGAEVIFGYLGYENTAQTLWIYHSWTQYYACMIDYCCEHYGFWGCLTHISELYGYVLRFGEHCSVSNGIDFLWTWPLAKLFGFPLYYNVKCLIILALNALAMRCLCRRSGCSPLASFLGGAIFAFNPWQLHLIVTGRIIESQTFLFVLTVLSFMEAKGSEDWRRWSLAGLMLALTATNYWFYGHFAVLFGAFLILWSISCAIYEHITGQNRLNFSFRSFFSVRRQLCALLFVLTFAAAILPSAQPYLVRIACGDDIPGMVRPDQNQQYDPSIFYRQSINYSCEIDYPFRKSFVQSPLSPACQIPLEHTFSANITFMALAACLTLFLYKNYPRRRLQIMWLAAAVCFYFLPLGPLLKWKGCFIGVFGRTLLTPYRVLCEYMPLFNKLVWPSQTMLLFILAVASFLALACDALQNHSKLSKPTLIGITVCLLILPVFEQLKRSHLPMPATEAPPKNTVVQKTDRPGAESGYIFVPVERKVWESALDFNRDFYYDSDLTLVDMRITVDGRKGLFSRHQYNTGKDSWLFEYQNMIDQPFVRFILDLGSETVPKSFSKEALAQVQNEGYRYIVVSERMCCHIKNRGSYLLDRHAGEIIYSDICSRLNAVFGQPVCELEETSYDRSLSGGMIEPNKYVLSFYDTQNPEIFKNISDK